MRQQVSMPECPVIPLRCNDLLFLNTYLSNGRNATRAYQVVHPKAKYTTAAARANKLLKKPSVQAELQTRVQYDAGITKAGIEGSLLKYQAWADAKRDYIAGASIAMDCARLAGFLVEKRETKLVNEEDSSAIRALVAQLVQPPTSQVIMTKAIRVEVTRSQDEPAPTGSSPEQPAASPLALTAVPPTA